MNGHIGILALVLARASEDDSARPTLHRSGARDRALSFGTTSLRHRPENNNLVKGHTLNKHMLTQLTTHTSRLGSGLGLHLHCELANRCTTM